ncbi:MAG: class I SAM-dependent methyltransferase, partial [Gemmataceae bacterium]
MIPPRFDLLAPHYRWMEAVSFGRLLHRCRVALLDRMTDARRALVLGDGDGRFLRDLLAVNPRVTVDAIDGSRAMIAEAERRAETVPGGRPRVRFQTADARTVPLPSAEYDLIVTHFFLDCFPQSQLGPLIERVAAACARGALCGHKSNAPRGGARRFVMSVVMPSCRELSPTPWGCLRTQQRHTPPHHHPPSPHPLLRGPTPG